MKGKRNIPKASVAFVLAAILLLAGGTALAATNAPDIISEDYKAEFEMDHIDAALVENGVQSKDIESHELLSKTDGNIQPGRAYKEELSAKNLSNVPVIVRMIIRVYWVDDQGNKVVTLDPGMVKLSYGNDDYNKGAWALNDEETTAETKVYYLKNLLPAGQTADPVVNKLRLDNSVLDEKEVTTEIKGNQTIYTTEYKYSGHKIYVEADCQSLQSHNANDAIESSWGVTNVKLSGNTITVG